METNTPRHCIHGVLENCCNVCDKDIDPCPSCAEKDAVNSALLDMMCEMSQCGRCEYLVGCESHEPSTDACAAHLLSEAERRVEGEKV